MVTSSSSDEELEGVWDIDYHTRFFGKPADHVKYGAECPLCNSRVDEFGWCACDAGGS